MNWSDERYVRVYTRDTPGWLMFSFNAKALWLLILRKADRSGVISLGKWGRRALATLVGHPEKTAELTEALGELLADGCCELNAEESSLVIPNFIEAQEATRSPTERQREYRERAREAAREGLPTSAQKGCVIYFVQSENGGEVKIGRADDLAKRMMGLQTGRPDKLLVLAAAPGTRGDERLLHDLLAKWRLRGEWFSPSPAVMRAVAHVNKLGGDSWDSIDSVLGDEMSPETQRASPETSPVASPVTPCCAVPCSAEERIASADASAPTQLKLTPDEPTAALVPKKPAAKRETNPRHGATIATFCALWTELRGGTYRLAGAKDGTAVKRLLAYPEATDAEIESRIRRAMGDSWFRQNGSLAVFVSQWSKWEAPKPAPLYEIDPDVNASWPTADPEIYEKQAAEADARHMARLAAQEAAHGAE